MSEDDRTEVTATAGPGGVSGGLKTKHAAEFVSVLSLLALSMLTYAYWKHDQQTEVAMSSIATAMKELAKGQQDATNSLTKAQQDSIAAQRELTCIISLPQDRREAEFTSPYGFCKRITSGMNSR